MDKRPEWLLRLNDQFWGHMRPIRAIAYFFVGHDVEYAYWRTEPDEPDWCGRCWYDDDERNLEEGWTMPRLLNHAYCWMVDRHWHWFDRFDDWACHNIKWSPRWWEY